jgi:cytochrome c
MIVGAYRHGIAIACASIVSLTAYGATTDNEPLPAAGERAHTPWVFRSVLDHRPRIVSLALSKTLWAAYDTQNAALYKVWRDGVEFDGAVYTTRHGPQPSAQGSGYVINDVTMPWRIIDHGREVTPKVQYLGHRFEDGHAYLHYALRYGTGAEVEIEELPEVAAATGRPGFFRRYEILKNPGRVQVAVITAVQSIKNQGDVQTNGQWTVESTKDMNGTLAIHGRLVLRPTTTQLITFFTDQPMLPSTVTAAVLKPGEALIEKSDCNTCHNVYERTVGPSYSQIAIRYGTTPANIDALAQKIISGGSGSWGNVPMSPHPMLPLEQAKTIISYILGLDKEDKNGMDFSAASAESGAAPMKLPRGLQPGLTVRYYELADPVEGVPVINEAQLPNKIATVPNVQFSPFAVQRSDMHLDRFPNHAKYVAIFSGSLNAPVAGEYGFRIEDANGYSRLFIESAKVLETQGSAAAEHKISLSAGWHPFMIEYGSSAEVLRLPEREIDMNTLKLSWHPPGQEEAIVPSTALASETPDLNATAAGPKAYTLMPSIDVPGDQFPLQGLHPVFKLVNIRPESFQPKVAGMDFLPDGRLVVSTWSPEGSVYILDGIHGNDPAGVKVKEIASGLAEPLGLRVVDGRIFVMQKQELTELVDRDGDEKTDEYRLVSNDWRVTDNFHEFSFGLLYDKGYFYATLATDVLPGGAPAIPQSPDRGKVLRINSKTGVAETVARGLRTPNGIGYGVDGEKFVSDNQGTWLPASKIVHVKQGAFYGFRSVDPGRDMKRPETPPVVWLPEDEINNSPSNTVPFNHGIYKGQMLHGDVTLGGLQRVFVEKIASDYQGCVFRLSQGLEAGVNRLIWGPDGALYVGGIGAPGNWGQQGKLQYGLQKLVLTDQAAFEMLAVRMKSNGVEIEFTAPLRLGGSPRPEDYEIRQWRYVPTNQYGGPKVDEEPLPVRSVRLSADRRRAFLELAGMKPKHVVYVHIVNPFVDTHNRELWSTESWCTVNAIPANNTGKPGNAAVPVNTLTPEETAAGWQLLFDGKTTRGWRNYNKPDIDSRWQVEEGALALTAAGGGDIVSEREFESFELTYEWKISPGGNSGLFFKVKEGDYDYVWRTGPEMQVLDDDAHPDGRLPSHRAGANYDLHVPRYSATKPVGQFNLARLVVNRGHVEHWLNGRKLVEYDLDSEDWKQRLAASKFKSMPDYARARSGHIALQDHGNQVWFRNMKIKPL